MLDELLKYHETPAKDDFTAQVMKRVQRKQRQRRMILWGSGLVGAAFGAIGVLTLSKPLGELFANSGPLPVSVGVVAAIALVAWLLQDEAATTG